MVLLGVGGIPLRNGEHPSGRWPRLRGQAQAGHAFTWGDVARGALAGAARPTTLAPVEPHRVSPAEHWAGIQTLIESVLTVEWLESKDAVDHPARFDWEFSKLMQRQDGSLSYPSQRSLIREHARLLLDMGTWTSAIPGSDRTHFRVGSIEGYGDERVSAKLRSELRNARAYGDWLVELRIAGTHRSAGRTVTPYETDGYPDLRIDVPGGALFAECKRLYAINEARLRAVIKKANRQLKLAADEVGEPYEGAVVLDLNGGRRIRFGSSEWTPPDIEETLGLVQRALSGEKNRSIRRAYVLWDDFRYAGDDPGRTVVAYTRRCRIVEHTGPARGLDLRVETFNGATTAAMIVWTPTRKV